MTSWLFNFKSEKPSMNFRLRACLAQQLRNTKEMIDEKAPEILRDQWHLDKHTTEHLYWHYGYMTALKDILDITSSVDDAKFS